MFRKTLISLAGAVVVLSGGVLRADDTDLYLNTDPPPPGSEPMVMFSIDYRPNLGSVVCRRGDAACDSLVDEGYLPDKGAGESYDFFDIIRGSFGKVLDEVGGVRLGLMFNHDHRNNCEGPDGSTDAGCSNGGYIALGFTSMPAINFRNATGQYVDESGVLTTRKSCGPFQGAGVPEANGDRSYGTCTEATRQKIHEILWEIPVSEGDRTHSYQGKELFFELYRYLRGFHVYNGHTGFTSYDGNDGYDTDGDGVADLLPDPLPTDAPYSNPVNDIQRAANEEANNWNLDADPLHVTYDPTALNAGDQVAKRTHRYAWDTDIEQASGSWHQYIDPFGTGQCTEVFTVNMMFQVSNQEADSDDEIRKSEENEGMGINKRNPLFEDVIAKMREEDQSDIAGDQGVTSYFLLADPFVNNRTGGKYAVAGGTGAPLLLSEDPDELIANLTDIFKQILSVSTTFVAASIPVNSFNRAEVLDNVYLALFQPHPDKDPYWFGNVKKLRLEGLNSGGNVFLEDANGNPAIAADGRIRFDSLTFWTDPTKFDVQEADVDLGEVSGRDGRSVNRGGGGHKQAGFGGGSPGAANGDTGARRILFDSTSSALSDLDANTLIASVLKQEFDPSAALSDAEVVDLIKWLRGQDVYDEDNDNDFDEGRRWYMASALHSRPIPINYGSRGSYTRTNPEIFVAVGTNDGMMRLIRNTPAGHGGGAQTAPTYGEELWAFAPRATMSTTEKLTRHYRGLPNFGIQPPYGVDGAPVVYVEEDGDGTIQSGEKVLLFFGLRRGGRSYYALDISDPENPDLLWRIDGGTGDFAELGYTFSTPVVGRINLSGTEKAVLIFGGGYDFAYDAGPGPVAASMGNGVFVVDALTGTLIRKFTSGVDDAIPSPITGVDLNGDGLIDRIIVGDMGGRVWRMDILAGSAPADWTLNKLASFGVRASADGDGSGDGVDRRFFHAPDVVPFRDSSGDYDAVIIGSGNRANPKGRSIDNAMFMVKDRAVSTINPPATGELTPTKESDLSNITNCTDASTCAATNLVNGWKYELEAAGEKSLSTPITLSGIVFFTTFVPPGTAIDPDADQCVPPEGQGRLYSVGLAEGNALVNRDRPIDQQESPGNPEDRYEKLSSAGIPAEVVSLPPRFILRPDLTVQEYTGRKRWRTFWYAEEDASQ
jgi:type IV pilus assembly protein PilY1